MRAIEPEQADDSIWDMYRSRHANLHRAADIVREALRDAILEGDVAPGARLREEELARQFRVSRTPVREALQQLSSEGLVQTSPHQGATVASLTVEDILAIYVVREALEGVSARLAARRATPEQCDRLLAIVEEMESKIADNDPAKMAELNLQFHAELRHAARNRHLDRFLSQIEHAVRRFGRTTFAYSGRMGTSIAEHRAIVDAVIAHDQVRAEALAIEHMREARQLRLRMLADDH
jgi:DNA-binding GntR family transcriptional regulator